MRNLLHTLEPVSRLFPNEGIFDTKLPDVSLVRADNVTSFEMVVYEPSVCFVLQGQKETRVNGKVLGSNRDICVVTSVSMPVVGAVVEATSTTPYFCLRIAISKKIIGQLVEELNTEDYDVSEAKGTTLARVDHNMMDLLTKLLDLLVEGKGNDQRIMAPLLQTQICWHLLKQPSARNTLLSAFASGNNSALYKTIKWIESNFSERMTVEQLAEMSAMSHSNFYSKFRSATGMSPLQFRNRLRLISARQQMLMSGIGAAQAGHNVGYQEPSQFSREYTRLFGLPPKKDVERLSSSTVRRFI